MKKQPHQLWRESDGDPKRYHELMVEHGHIVKRDPPSPDELCANCGEAYQVHIAWELTFRCRNETTFFKRLPAALPCGWYPGKPLR